MEKHIHDEALAITKKNYLADERTKRVIKSRNKRGGKSLWGACTKSLVRVSPSGSRNADSSVNGTGYGLVPGEKLGTAPSTAFPGRKSLKIEKSFLIPSRTRQKQKQEAGRAFGSVFSNEPLVRLGVTKVIC
ncbi:hypothetical protein RRG08_038103 [Elysia crispata]|uniref:Uncharacterized protein n=1 Tax=Elysia crispata TaxID=231223 RepID=A0AAE1DP19_9GAST|nr:hypothetical protein RRG08_038103 [Elysia crispata]